MANPFLVLGGIAVGIITAAFGVLAVPGWVASAQDASTVNDLGSIRAVQAAAASQDGTYIGDIARVTAGTAGIEATLSSGTSIIGLASEVNTAWCTIAQSASGKFFAASNDGLSSQPAAHPQVAATGAGCKTPQMTSVLEQAYGPVVATRQNLAVNPRGGTWKSATAPAWGFQSDRYSASGAYTTVNGWARFTANDREQAYGFHLANNPDFGAPTSSHLVAVQPGRPYTISLRARIEGATRDALLCWRFANEANAWAAPRDCAIAKDLSSAGQQLRATFTPPAGSTRAAAYVMAYIPSGAYIEATDLLIEQAATAGTFFDGSDPGTDARTQSSWTGESGASPSVLVRR